MGLVFVCLFVCLFVFIQSVTLCLLIVAFSPLKFRVSTERYEFIAIMMLVELEFLVVFSGPF